MATSRNSLTGFARALFHLLPPYLRMHWIAAENWMKGEPELRLLPWLCDRMRTSVDVGASIGVYAYFMRRHSRSVVAIEPKPSDAAWLRRALGRNVQILEIAASDRAGHAPLRIPHDRVSGGMATLEAENRLEAIAGDSVHVIDVVVQPLDALPIGQTGLVKIDVEGHELAVLRGAVGILRRDRPALLIELEERHRAGAVADVEVMLAELGFDGWYFRDGRLCPIREFDVGRDQPSTGVERGHKVRGRTYLNNFVFVHREDERRRARLRRYAR